MLERAKIASSKAEKADELLSLLDKIVHDNGVVFNLPKAAGVIKECQDKMILLMSTLQKAGIEFWLDRNSLLAACRTKEMLPWETKSYIGMLDETWNELLCSNILKKHNIVAKNNVLTFNECLGLDVLQPEVVVCIWKESMERIYTDEIDIDKGIIYPLAKMMLAECTFNAPRDSWSIMKIEFGDDWKKFI